MNQVLRSMLVCPRCRGELTFDDAAHCARCRTAFPIRDGVPRMNDGAPERDARFAAEWKAQSNAHTLYVDHDLIMNRWEERVMPRLLDWLGDLGGPVLDVGCGVGRFGKVLTDLGRRDVQLVGLDFQGELLAEARDGYVGLIEGDAHHLPLRDGTFAAVIATNALHHFPDPEMAIAEITRVLRPGGTFVGYDPRFVTPLEKVKKLVRRHDHAFTEDHRAFRVDEYRTLLGAGGLTVRDVLTVNPIGPLFATGLDYLKFGRFAGAQATARALEAADSLVAGRAWRGSPLGLMLAGRATK